MTVKIDGTNTVANPAFTGADTDTGLQCGTNEVKLVTGGSARATVDSSGNFGIGTTTPHNNAGTNLHIHGSNTSAEIRLTNTTTGTGANGAVIQQSGNTLYILNSEASNIVFENNGSERLRITSNGTLQLRNSPGIDFSQIQTNATNMSSETLDSYEEGTWTPTMNKSGVGGTVTNPSTALGYYRKIGKLLYISWYLYKGSGGFGNNTGEWYVSGLPFSLAHGSGAAYQSISAGYTQLNGTNYQNDATRWQSNNTNGSDTLAMYGPVATTNWTSGYLEFSGSGTLMLP